MQIAGFIFVLESIKQICESREKILQEFEEINKKQRIRKD